MLVQFDVTNYRSINDTASLSMLGTTDSSHKESLIKIDEKKILPVAAIYGANAAGKSNILLAFEMMKDMITGSNAQLLKDKKLPYDPFIFTDVNEHKATEFGIIYYYNGIKYAYSFAYDEDQIISEELMHWPKGREALIFSREKDIYIFRENEKEQKILAGRTPKNRLYLVTSNEWNAPQTDQAYKWFTEKHITFDQENMFDATIDAVQDTQSSSLRDRILTELCLADLGIVDVGIKDNSYTAGMRTVLMVHRTEGENGSIEFQLPLGHESVGTQKFFSRIGPWMKALEEGLILFVDELEASMHPLLTKRLVEMIQDPEINRNHAQLVFTTHDAMLLDLGLLRRDQIWFADKDPQTLSTELFSLWDFSVRKDENIRKGYLQGRYGAIPFLGGEV